MINIRTLRAVWLLASQQRLKRGSRVSESASNASFFSRATTSRNLILGLLLLFAAPGLFFGPTVRGQDLRLDENPLAMPEVGSHELRILSPTLLELTLITSKAPAPARVSEWDFVNETSQALNLPGLQEFEVRADGQALAVQRVGFKRRVLYAPLKERDLRIGNYLYLQLASPIADNQQVEVRNPGGRLWNTSRRFASLAHPHRWNPAIHASQVGYVPGMTKKAMVGYYLGSLGEMAVPAQNGFRIVDASTGATVHQGWMLRRQDIGYTYSPAPYQQVWEADFTLFRTPGEYRLVVPGMGASFPFLINEGVGATFARTYALGLYHQRCGGSNHAPFTRHTHADCHKAHAEIPTLSFAKTQEFIASASSDFRNTPRHTAPQLSNVNTSRYPFVNQGRVDVSGGHHDAGDYSKYTINSAGLIHHVAFAADAFAGVGALDNLGLPESGDGKSDMLQVAKWEADFLAKMQDADGGFYFLVYPKERRYEDNVLPEHGDPQVVWPKNTAVTAAAVAALAEMGSSPRFKQQFPVEAALYMEKARKGWAFLENAIAKFGKDGAYQKLTHYGHEFMHDDELAWAAAAMFAATGEETFHQRLKSWYDPANRATRRWDWWRLYEGYGCAARTYAFAARSGRLKPSQLDLAYLAKCEAEIIAAAQDQVRFARQSAYGTSFSDEYKKHRSAGWFFSSERMFDIATAYQISPRAEFLDTLVSNFNYEAGCNPINMTFVTGIGWKRQRDIVHHYAQNDHRVMPPTGIPLGNIQADFQNTLHHYKKELQGLTFPSDYGGPHSFYPMQDRWADTFNTTTEFVVMDQARGLASAAFFMALTSLRDQPWRSAVPSVVGLPKEAPLDRSITLSLSLPGIDLKGARILWESKDQQPYIGNSFTFRARTPGEQWVEVEAQLPDGRRVFAATNYIAIFPESTPPNSYLFAPLPVTKETVALFHLDTDTADTFGRAAEARLEGEARLDTANVGWMANRSGRSLRVRDIQDRAVTQIPARAIYSGPETSLISVEAMLFINEFKGYNKGNPRILSLNQGWNCFMELAEDAYAGPQFRGGANFSTSGSEIRNALPIKQWFHLSITLDRNGYTMRINGAVVRIQPSADLPNWGNGQPARLEFGGFDGWVDEVAVKSVGTSMPANLAPVVTMSGPVSGTVFDAPGFVVLTANASDTDGSIASVEFFQGGTKLGESKTAPYSFTWSNVPAGTYSLTARATDNAGAVTTSSPISVSVGSGAQTTLSPPVFAPGGGSFNAPTAVALSASGGAEIRYTIDGSEPTASSTRYGAPLILSTTGTVKARAFGPGGAVSSTVAATFTITSSQPVILKGGASFVRLDATTRGNWYGTYGAEGYNVIGDKAALPSYSQLASAGKQNYVWLQSTSDDRALQKMGSVDRIASAWYAASPFTLDMRLSGDQNRTVALYAVDWDSKGRQQRIDVLDLETGAVLDSRTLADFQKGSYLVWNIRGNVRFRFTALAGPNALLSGVFFGAGLPGVPVDAPATLVTTDSSTKGNWKGVYGTAGYNVIGNAANYPGGVSVSVAGKADYAWANPTSDTRALMKVAGTDRLAACWHADESFTVDLQIPDGQVYRTALYFLDWDRLGRSQKVEILDLANGSVLATADVTNFQEGKYLVWDLKGRIRVRVRKVIGPNAVMMGMFFDARPAQSPSSPSEPLQNGNSSASQALDGSLQVRVEGQPGQRFVIQSSTDLREWTSVTTNSLSSGGFEFRDFGMPNVEQRFYRAVPLD